MFDRLHQSMDADRKGRNALRQQMQMQKRKRASLSFFGTNPSHWEATPCTTTTTTTISGQSHTYTVFIHAHRGKWGKSTTSSTLNVHSECPSSQERNWKLLQWKKNSTQNPVINLTLCYKDNQSSCWPNACIHRLKSLAPSDMMQLSFLLSKRCHASFVRVSEGRYRRGFVADIRDESRKP